MAKTITIDDINVTTWTVDLLKENVTAVYEILVNDGSVYKTDTVVFWRVIPTPGNDPNGDPIPNPPSWYQLPDSSIDFGIKTYAQIFALLTADIRQALMPLVS